MVIVMGPRVQQRTSQPISVNNFTSRKNIAGQVQRSLLKTPLPKTWERPSEKIQFSKLHFEPGLFELKGSKV